jgi:16S rRNA processing protein RimM
MDLVVGRVVKSHGIHGELVVQARTDSPDQRFAPGASLRGSLRDQPTRRYTVEGAREHSGRLLVALAEVADRSAADALRGMLFLVDSDDLPPSTDPDEFYDHELEGLEARLTDGTVLGTVAEVLHAPGSDLLAVRSDGREILIPFVTAIVPTVSVSDGYVVVDPPEGLLEQ